MIAKDSIIYNDPQGVGYINHTLMNASPIRGSYSVKDGTELIMAMAFRKQKELSEITLPSSLLVIGDAAFSQCKALKKITIPASVKRIGVAAFCNSALEEVTFQGTPEVIDYKAFIACSSLKRILVPEGKKQSFIKLLGGDTPFEIVERRPKSEQEEEQYEPQMGRVIYQNNLFGEREIVGIQQPNLFAPKKPKHETQSTTTLKVEKDLFGNKIVKSTQFSYNQTTFNWAVDDDVKLSELFCGPTLLKGDPSYQFRKKALFVFLKSKTVSITNSSHCKEYTLQANTSIFQRKYEDKYGRFNSPVRIFLFVCDDEENAKFYDEVRLQRIASDTIVVKSLIRFC